MRWGKLIKGAIETAVGPGFAGVADIAAGFGSDKKAATVYPGQQRTIGPGPQPPAGSIEQSRGQNKQRMKSIYNYP